MKEQRFFYTTDPASGVLPPDEGQHVVRVLRLGMGDELNLLDGQGHVFRAVITETDNRHCYYRIEETITPTREWTGDIHIAVAPTKHMDRMEWLAEKATEIGIDCLSLLDCRFSERKVVKTDRLEKIVVAAMKQSHKVWKPQVDAITAFKTFIRRTDLPQQRFIAHCYEGDKPFLLDVLQPRVPSLVMIGPEGDFSIDEVREAEAAGFQSVSLGTSRLRTETAALAAVHMMRLANR